MAPLRNWLFTVFAAFGLAFSLQGQDPTNLGDLDADGEPTVKDIALLVSHLQGTQFLPQNVTPFADVNQDTFVNTFDVEALTDVILEREPFVEFPLAEVAQFSPIDGEANVAVSRETILRFTLPLAEGTVLTTEHLQAYYAGAPILSRVELSRDRLKATLFYQEKLPSSARIRVVFDSEGVQDYLGREIDPDGDGEPGDLAFVDFDTISISTVPDTAIEGHVYDAELGPGAIKVPLEGVIIEIVGAEQDLRTTTDAEGYFMLRGAYNEDTETYSGIPSGRFFVNVDGRAATAHFPAAEGESEGELRTSDFPQGNYYPFIGKPWEAVAGRSDNTVNGTGEIFLPFVRAGSLQETSLTEDTEVVFPDAVVNADPTENVGRTYDPEDLEGVSVTVPAGALYSNDGARGGRVGIAPVQPQRLPEPLPEGLDLPLVITVQTDGPTNFDVPVPARFPNLPDPITGEILPPGAKSALWSFNHDTGEWEIAGPMTVSADGKYVVSDPGVGIRQPGWHGTQQGTDVSGGGPSTTGGGDGDGDDDDDEEDDPPCEETGKEGDWGEWECVTPGAITNAGSFESEEVTICADMERPGTPNITGTEFEDGTKKRKRTHSFVCEDTPRPPTEEEADITYTPEYEWMPGDPATYEFTEGGTFEFTAQVRGKGDACSDLGPQQVAGTLTVHVIKISEIEFSEEGIPADGESTVTASATIEPSDRSLVWSIEGDTLGGATIDPNTGVITAGTEPGLLKVRATDSEMDDCFKEKGLCHGQDDCCPDFSGTFSLGPLTISLPSGVVSNGEEDGLCLYETSAGVTMQVQGVFTRTASIEGATVSWKADQDGNVVEGTVEWTGRKEMPKWGVITASLTGASLTVDDGGGLSGDVTFTIEQNADVNIGGIAVLKEGLSGDFTYAYNNSGGFNGAWDFSEITGFQVDLKKGNSVIGSVTAEAIDLNGNVTNARFTANTPGTWQTNGFTATLEELDLGMNFSIAETELEFLGGTGRVRVEDIPNVQGSFIFQLTFTPTNVTASVEVEEIEAFGCDISGELSVTFSYEFDFEEIAGEGIEAKHQEFDQSFSGVSFAISDGAVHRFSIAQISVKYKDTIKFTMANAAYIRAQGSVVFDASVMVPTLEMGVRKFAIAGDGSVTVGNIYASINKSPIVASIDVAFSDSEFRGDFSGQFASTISIRGTLVVGATPDFNYGYFSLQVSTPGFLLGNSGLKIVSLAGEFGYNWEAPGGADGTGMAVQGSLTIGFGLGISDVGNLALIEGYARLILGNATTIELEGAVRVTSSPPHIFQGELMISYTLGSGAYEGSINSTVMLPPGDGRIVRLDSGSIEYKVAAGQYSVVGESVTGMIFNAVDVEAGINIRGPMASAGSVSGRVFGQLSYEETFNYVWPAGFNSTNCSTADSTDSWTGFGIEGELNLELAGGLNANFNSQGFTGSIFANGGGSNTMRVKWPCVIVCTGNCVSQYSVSLSGRITLEQNGSSTRLHGRVTFSTGNESEEAEIDFTI